MTYQVSFQQVGAMPYAIGLYGSMEAALAAAAANGAIIPPAAADGDLSMEVAGHEGDDNFAIWIEASHD